MEMPWSGRRRDVRLLDMSQLRARGNAQFGQHRRGNSRRREPGESARLLRALLLISVTVALADRYAMDAARAADHDRDRPAGRPLRHVPLRQHRAHEQRGREEEVGEDRSAASHWAGALGC